MKSIAHTMIAGLMLLGAATAAKAETKVTIGDLNWTGPQATAAVIKTIIKKRLGGEAEIVAGLSDQAIIAAGMDKGDGSVDVYTELWMPNQQSIWDKYIDGAKTIAHNKPYAGTEKLFVPAYMADRVKTIEDLRDPQIAALFDSDGNGKGEYWPGDAGWKATKVWQIKFRDYGLSDLWEPIVYSDGTLKTQLKSAYEAQKPILFYYWTPEWIHAAYQLQALEGEPDSTPDCSSLKLDQEDWLAASKFNCAHPDSAVYVAYSKSLEKRNPAAAKFLSQIQLDPAVVNQWILSIGRDGLSPQEVAEAWVDDPANAAMIDAWVK